jgi:predicted DNA-binding transcriptional regulator AlpA
MAVRRKPPLVGIAEIAAKSARPKQTVLHWTRRDSFPKPAASLRMGSAWDEREVNEWLQKNNIPIVA